MAAKFRVGCDQWSAGTFTSVLFKPVLGHEGFRSVEAAAGSPRVHKRLLGFLVLALNNNAQAETTNWVEHGARRIPAVHEAVRQE